MLIQEVQAAVAWTAGIAGGAGSCFRQGLEASLAQIAEADAPRNALIYIGDGGGTCRVLQRWSV